MKLKITLLATLLCAALSHSQTEFVNQDFGENGLLCVDIQGQTIKMGDMIKVNGEFYGLANFIDHHLVKFTSNGQLITSFGTNGYRPISIGSGEGGLGLHESHLMLTPDNNLLMVSIFDGAFNNHFITKTDLSGNTIASFGVGGYLSAWGSDRIIFFTPQIINNEIILVGAGNTNDGENVSRYLIVMKFDLNGQWVTSFGNNGMLTAPIDNHIFVMDAHYYPETNKVVMLGDYWSDVNTHGLLQQFNMYNGTPDTSFGTGGQITYTQNDETYMYVRAMHCADNKVYVAGSANEPSGSWEFVDKFDSNGQPDTAFGNGGRAVRPVENMLGHMPSAISADNGDLMITGQLTPVDTDYEKIFLWKISGSGATVTDFGNNGMIINPMNLAHYGAGWKTIIEDNLITVATLSMSCSSDDQPKPAVIQFNTGEVSVDEYQIAKAGSYPNPVKDILHFTTSGTIEKAEVYDLSGKLVIAANPASNSIDLSGLQSGFYMVRVFENGAISNLKIIKG